MNEVQENVISRFGSKTRVVFTTSPGYASMPPALQFDLNSRGECRADPDGSSQSRVGTDELEASQVRTGGGVEVVSHALRGFYELADIRIVLDEVLLLEISNFARQLKFSPAIGDDHPIINHLTASLWFLSMDLTITSSISKSRGPSDEIKNVAATEKQLESMVYRLTQERGRRPFLTPRLENATEKTKENAPPLVKQIWSFLEEQLEVAENRDMTVTRFVTAANEVTIGGFWREHAKGELKTRRDHEILKFLSPCWGKEFMAGVFGVETLRVDGYLALVLLTHGELVSFHRLTKYGEPLSMGKTYSSIDTYSYKCAAGLKTLLVKYLLMQNRHMTGVEKNPKTKDERRKVNGGMPLLTDLCLAMRSDPSGRDIRVSRSSSDGLSQLRDTLEPHK